MNALQEKNSTPPRRPLPVLRLEPDCYSHTQDCVQCGLCLPACPTYTITGLEADSPRGRIRLIKALADGRIQPTPQVASHLDLCLDCRACETACPSAVTYHELIETTRAQMRPTTPTIPKIIDWAVRNILPHPARFNWAMRPVWALRKIGLWQPLVRRIARRIVSEQLLSLLDKAPDPPAHNTFRLWGRHEPKPVDGILRGRGRGKVSLFVGCVGQVLGSQLHHQTIRLFQHLGFEVIVPPDQVCCGAMHQHRGDPEQASRFAAANIAAFAPDQVHAPNEPLRIVTNIAGCGAMLRQYSQLMRRRGHWAHAAQQFAARVRDVTEFLADAHLPPPTRELHQTVTYHDACHLAHAQGVTNPPRQLLASIKGLQVIPLPEASMCCGAAGAYHLFEPEMAAALGQRKIQHVIATTTRTVVSGNIGCSLHLQTTAKRMGLDLHCLHPITLLYQAYADSSPVFPVASDGGP